MPNPPRVMVVEDDPLTARWLGGIVTGQGFVLEGPYGSEIAAMGSAAFERPDAAILDLDISGGSAGRRTSVRIMTMLQDLSVPFLIYTGQPEIGLASRGGRAAPVIAKPTGADRIADMLAGLLDTEKRGRQDS